MSLRLLEFVVRPDRVEDITALLEDKNIHHMWVTESNDSSAAVRILLDAEAVEEITDLLADRMGRDEDHRMVLVAVEATVPRIEEPPEEEAEEESAEEKEKRALRISREELYEDLKSGTRLTPSYAAMVALSTVVAAVGLVSGDVAIIIGAMVIAPLLGPTMALAFANTLGDTALTKGALKTMAVAFAIAAAISIALGVVLDVDPAAPEIASRIGAGFGNIALALAAGAAGSLAFTTGVPAALVGVMVAVALLPPLTAAGLLAGDGHLQQSLGALLLLVTNVASISIAAMATFAIQRVRPRTWWEAEQATKARRTAIIAWAITLAILAAIIAFGQVSAV